MTQCGTQQKEVQLPRKGGVTPVTFGAHKVEIDDAAKTVTACPGKGIAMDTAAAANDSAQVSIGGNFNTVVLKGVSVGRAFRAGHFACFSPANYTIFRPCPCPTPLRMNCAHAFPCPILSASG